MHFQEADFREFNTVDPGLRPRLETEFGFDPMKQYFCQYCETWYWGGELKLEWYSGWKPGDFHFTEVRHFYGRKCPNKNCYGIILGF